mmetsp:Transcript_14590/g.29520  ORF Transcript_14590/g.29520 Transcript_14590/m.29520 type:complete len:415 (+) Transcript_14590:120-1364(+)|eukprot:CAMPEP_0167828186 /NCGR_PEP_ID=MMETSP0112_2-20121227/11227_1 /TAXON_ID=91324 /ORGANISM="Lotharella globosa, Strain CCCM811" /LENGTH=414 /DNA_ID=CAMNT_0007731267 /DNA_START=105 /DNA_END=1349 /DNA_ORIENTATION=+
MVIGKLLLLLCATQRAVSLHSDNSGAKATMDAELEKNFENSQAHCASIVRNCENTGTCLSVDIGAPDDILRHDTCNAEVSPWKVDDLDDLREKVKGRHLRIRNINKFLSGCGFFTFPLIVMNQLLVAKRLDLIGDKAPFVYMPENHHYHDCYTTPSDQSEKPDFWEKWFKPVGKTNWRTANESDVWEFTQDSILTIYYDPDGIHAYPYNNEEDTGSAKWLEGHRKRAYSVMDQIAVKSELKDEAKVFYLSKFGSFDNPVLGLHMRGTDKFVMKKADPKDYVRLSHKYIEKHGNNTKLFLATDDRKYLEMMQEQFSNPMVSRPTMRSPENILYVDAVSKDQKAKDVLMDSLILAMTTSLVKSWSAVSEFSVYLRKSWTEFKPFGKVVDLQIGDGGEGHPIPQGAKLPRSSFDIDG